jgi:drug/metabolite transporter (DMT)-like permease
MQRRLARGTGWAALGVLAFSGTLPSTRFAVQGFDAATFGAARTVAAAVLAIAVLVVLRVPRPDRAAWPGLLLVAYGAALGFGFFTSIALRTEPASHGAVVIALMPILTAVIGTVRGDEHPPPVFWLAALLGTVVVLTYVVARSEGQPSLADVWLLLAAVCGAVGYAEGGRLTRTMPGTQVISWALVLTLPVALPLLVVTWVLAGDAVLDVQVGAVLGAVYAVVISMFLGFVVWFRGLAEAGIARASQLQLVQPLLTVGWAALLLSEPIGADTLVTALVVVACVGVTQWVRIGTRSARSEPAERVGV